MAGNDHDAALTMAARQFDYHPYLVAAMLANSGIVCLHCGAMKR